jgi:phosphoglycolate phosphatase
VRVIHLLFDLDGTLTDPFVGITTCIRHALESLGRPAPPAEELRWCIGPPLKESFATLLGPEQAHRADEALAKYRERFATVGLFENTLYSAVPAVLAELQTDGYVLRVATSKPGMYATRIVAHFDLAPYFTSVEGSELDGRLVDKGALIAHILWQNGLAPVDVLMIGDREHDVAGARANGVSALGVLWGYGSRAELERAGALACVGTPAELLATIRRVRPPRGADGAGHSDAVGLESGMVRLADYDLRWPGVFAAEAARLATAAPGLAWRFEHIGSTSIPGVCAKPIIDIAAGRPPGSTIGEYVAALEAAGYRYRGELGVTGREFFCAGEPRKFHLHLVEEGGPLWRAYLEFRDHLREHPDEAREYGAFKLGLAARFPRDRHGYMNAKSVWVEALLARAGASCLGEAGTSAAPPASGPDHGHSRIR